MTRSQQHHDDTPRRLRLSAWLAVGSLAMMGLVAACTLDVPLGHNNPDDEASSRNPGEADPDSPSTQGETPPITPKPCDPGPDDDEDGDGFSIAEGDCNDCNPFIGPSAIEVSEAGPNGIDEDCDGLVDEVAAYCDAHLALESLSPWDAARALDLCHIAQGPKDWGLVDARWALPDGDLPPADLLVEYHLGHGLLDGFGPQVKVQRGERMLALSSGTARRPGDPNHHTSEGFRKGYTSGSPISGGTSPSCPDVVTGEPRDGVALEVVLRAPANVGSFSFDFDFYTHEWPTYICSPSNDYFVALMMPPPANLPGGNISLDAAGNPISVNTAFLDVCGCAANPPNVCMAGGKPFECVLGNGELVGTGYGADSGTGDHAATSWLTTTAPVEAGSEIKLRFTTYDSDDGDHDSLTLVDNFRWHASPTDVRTTRVPK